MAEPNSLMICEKMAYCIFDQRLIDDFDYFAVLSCRGLMEKIRPKYNKLL